MSGHADTIREALDFYARHPQPTPRTVAGPPCGLRYDRALAALDALVAKNQQQAQTIERLSVLVGEAGDFAEKATAENQHLRDALAACDVALNWDDPRIIPTEEVPDRATALSSARVALAATPSEDHRMSEAADIIESQRKWIKKAELLVIERDALVAENQQQAQATKQLAEELADLQLILIERNAENQQLRDALTKIAESEIAPSVDVYSIQAFGFVREVARVALAATPSEDHRMSEAADIIESQRKWIKKAELLVIERDALVAENQQQAETIAALTPAAKLLIYLDDQWFDPHPSTSSEVEAATAPARAALAGAPSEDTE